MRGKPHQQHQHTPTPAPQQIVLRALVGSLVVCAALGAVDTSARAADGYAAAHIRASVAFKSRAHVRRADYNRGAHVARAVCPNAARLTASTHLTASVSGKWLSPSLGMTRERSGNLLSQNLAIP